jgi:ubiquinone/menaquinone biosynthesis C-methylase UbiE
LYDKCVSLLNIQENETVLELGCGTGFLTQKLVEKKAVVTSIDQSAGMLVRAKQRVSGAKFIQTNFLQYMDTKRYDYVMLFFVLHELNAIERRTILKSAKDFLNENGEIIICDFAVPDKGMMRSLFPKLLRLWESPNTIDLLENGFYAENSDNRISIHSHRYLHNGRAQLINLRTAKTRSGIRLKSSLSPNC